MALKDNPLVSSATVAANLRVLPYDGGMLVGKLGAASVVTALAKLTPLAWDAGNDWWRPFGPPVAEVKSITVDATGGTFTISVDGEVTAAIAFNATGAAVTTALELLSNVQAGDIVVTGGPGDDGGTTPYVLTFGGRYLGGLAIPTITTGVGSLTGGGGTAAVGQTTAASTDDRHIIRGFLWPDTVTLDDSDEVLANIMTHGRLHAVDVPLPSGVSQNALNAALRGDYGSLRQNGLLVEGITDLI